MKQLCVPKALETCLHRKHTFKYIEPTATLRVLLHRYMLLVRI